MNKYTDIFSPENNHQQDDRKNEIMQANKYSPKIFNDILSDSIDRILKGEDQQREMKEKLYWLKSQILTNPWIMLNRSCAAKGQTS
jgi:hypothetical protein